MRRSRALIFLVIFWLWAIPAFSEEQKAILPTLLLLPEANKIPKLVSVSLFVNVPSISLETENAYEIKKELKDEKIILKDDKPLKAVIRPRKEGFEINGKLYNTDQFTLNTSSGWVQVDKRKYRGQVRVLKTPKDLLTVVNDVDLEEYLKGVLPLEVHYDWPLEALKAHAVISRTFALFKAVEKQSLRYSLRDTVESQVYGGALFHKPETDRAVDATRGEILTFRGQIFPSYFHSVCGGRTAKADLIWSVQPNPVLKGVVCLFCRGARHWKWSLVLPLSKIESIMQKKGYPAKNLKRISFVGRDPSSRASKIVLEYKSSKLTLPAADFRAFIGYDQLRSLKADVEIKNGEAHFHGFGWGHGIGFCQWGAKHQAELGKTYREILKFYFPGSEIKKIT